MAGRFHALPPAGLRKLYEAFPYLTNQHSLPGKPGT